MATEDVKTLVERLHAHQRAVEEQRAAEHVLPGQKANEARADQARQTSPGEFTTAMVHLYRAEVTKAETWRRRLDTTTNWAVVTTAAAISFALGGTEPERHVVILLISVLVTFFLLLESRRYRHYDIWQTRVHLLESDYFAPMLEPDGPPAHPNWLKLLAADLRQPQYHISFAEALGWRLRRNYVWIYLTHLITWLVKVAIHPTTITSFDDFLRRAALGPVSGWTMLIFGLVFNGTLIFIAILTAGRQTASGEIVTAYEKIRKKELKLDERLLPFGEI